MPGSASWLRRPASAGTNRRLRHLEDNRDLVLGPLDADDTVAVDAAPGGNVALGARIGAAHAKPVSDLEGGDAVLGANDGERTEQAACVEDLDAVRWKLRLRSHRQMYHSAGISEGDSGATVTTSASRPFTPISTSTRSASLP